MVYLHDPKVCRMTGQKRPPLHQVFIQLCRIVCFVEKLAAFCALVTGENRLHRNSGKQTEHSPFCVLVLSDHQWVVAVMAAGTFFQRSSRSLVIHLSMLLNLRLHSKDFLI